MQVNLQNKVIMVAAASKGLGYGIAQALAEEGASVSIASRNHNNIQQAASTLSSQFEVDAKGYVMDATDPQSISNWANATREHWGRIDGLVVNAGGPPPGQFDDFNDDAWHGAFTLTLLSAVRLIRAVLPAMRENGHGSILTVTSTSVKEPIDMLLLSNVMRAGVTSLVKSLSRDLAPENIRINNLIPGRIDTERVRFLDATAAKQQGISTEDCRQKRQQAIPMGRYGSIEEFGAAGAFLLSDAASYITGATLIVDGGMTKTVW